MAQTVLLETSLGNITVELYNNEAPKTCRNFATLASRNYYNGTIFVGSCDRRRHRAFV